VAAVLAGAAALYHYAGYGSEAVREQVQPVLGLACLWWCFALLWVKSFPARQPCGTVRWCAPAWDC
jgi:phosphatidate cytidylyltransferase